MDIAKESIYWIFRIMAVSLIIVILIIMIGSISDHEVEDNKIKSEILRNKIILDENCLAYSDHRVHLGMIDKKKFNELHLENCINEGIGVVLNLTYDNFSEEILINDDLADKIDFCYDEKTFYCEREIYYLILKDDSAEIPSTLIIDAIRLK